MRLLKSPRMQVHELEDRTLGLNQNIYLSNATQQNVYVMPCRRLGWVIADVVTDVALVALAIAEVQFVLAGGMATIPHSVTTFADLFKIIRSAAQLLSATTTITTRPLEAAHEIIEWFKNEVVVIPPRKTVNVLSAGVLQTYLQPSGIVGLLNAPTISLIMVSSDGKHVTSWTSGPDMSWVVREQGVYRVTYGRLWVPDPDYTVIKPDHPEEAEQRRRDDSDDHNTIVNDVEIPWVVKWDT